MASLFLVEVHISPGAFLARSSPAPGRSAGAKSKEEEAAGLGLLQVQAGLGQQDPAATARSAWESKWNQPFPGRQWGMEPNCRASHASVRKPQLRTEWVAERLQKQPADALTGVEIGACNLPVEMPKNVHMRYVDHIADKEGMKSACLGGADGQLPDIVDDASRLIKVEDETFDLLLAAHVVEHMADVLGALQHWLRVVKRGGLLFLVAPDPCDPVFPFGDRLRLVARPEHFVEEYLNKSASTANFGGHFLEQGVSLGGVNVLRASSGVQFINFSCTRSDDIDAFTKMFGEASGLHSFVDVPADFDPATIKSEAKCASGKPHNVHLHTWSPHSLRAMLAKASELFKPQGMTLVVEEVHSVGRTVANMQELRVIIRRT
ncbi:unnamed protein product [Polarella glacialis]|uniref:Methyltransferase type 11 domain-containing protein n=1 Tax=Polarella glacialis TaxID=89957 RepID=A0A813J0F0_POLGL|nr:unnamed protein product [Polarella glacialis]